MKRSLWLIVLTGLAAAIGAAGADAPSANKPKASNESTQKRTFLGVAVEALPPALANHLPGVVPKGEGLLVTHVAKDSPAAKVHVESGDILLKFGDQSLSSPEQLVQMVSGDKPGQEVALVFVHAGKSETCKVKLSEHQFPTIPDRRVFRTQPDQQIRDVFEEFESNNNGQWEEFDGMKLTKLPSNRWRAEIDYRDKDGKKEHKSFEGSREELRKDLRTEKDLPLQERRHLLRALNLQEPVFEFHLAPLDSYWPDF